MATNPGRQTRGYVPQRIFTMSVEEKRLIVEPKQPKRARLIVGKFGRPVSMTPKGAPAMTPEHIRKLLNELP